MNMNQANPYQQVQSASLNNQPINKDSKDSGKRKLRKVFIVLIFLGLIVTGLSIFLLIDDNNKYNEYTPIAADLVDFKPVYKNGITYYRGNYKYIVDKKEYFYKSNKLSTNNPDKLIQIKYNPKEPEKVYNQDASNVFLIMLISSLSFIFICTIVAISLSTSKIKEIITVQVIDQVTCVGGRRIYLSNVNINAQDPLSTTKYYVYFSNDLGKFAIGNLLTFNIYKYNEVFTTENYKNVYARVIYNFKDEDFTLIATPQKK